MMECSNLAGCVANAVCSLMGLCAAERIRTTMSKEGLAVRQRETVTICGTEVSFDVSQCHGEIPLSVKASLGRLVDLSERTTGWDSYGSTRLDPRVVKPAVTLIVDGFRPCLTPEISLTSVGGLNLSWECESGRELEIELFPNGTCDYVYEDETGELTPPGPVSLAEAREVLGKLYS